jgi:hypothetical protein
VPKPTEKDRVKRHFERIRAADKVFDRWQKKYQCERLVEYYCGEQHPDFVPPDSNPRYQPYTVNLIFPTLETQRPSLLFHRPQVKIEPKPPYGDDPMSTIAQRAKLCEDTVQTFIDDPVVGFGPHTNLALLDASFRFGIVEVGYTADWIDNPHAGKPMLKEGTDEEMTDQGGNAIIHPDKLPQSEQLYIKRIDPGCFRVSISQKNLLPENDWVGYYEWAYVEDVKRNPKYRNTSSLKPSGRAKDEPEPGSDEEREARSGMVKLWKIWDLRTKTRCVLADGHDKYLVEGEAWTYLPLAALKFHEIPSQWYPLPPVSNWIGPQDVVNEVRESRRAHRRRFYRRYTMRKGAMEPTELEKLETGGDGVVAEHQGQPNEQVIIPVIDAPLGGDFDKDLLEAKDDFMQVSGVGAEQRGTAEADTATQANIIDVRTRIRESASRVEVANWLGEVCRLMLLTIREKMQLEFWVKRNMDVIAQDPQELERIAVTWQQVTAANLGDGNLDVKVDITSLSPVSEEQRAMQWNQMLALITNPALAMILAMSEPLLRKTLKFYGITSQGDIAEIKNVLQVMLQMQLASQMAASTAGTPSGKQPGQPAGLPASGGTVQ